MIVHPVEQSTYLVHPPLALVTLHPGLLHDLVVLFATIEDILRLDGEPVNLYRLGVWLAPLWWGLEAEVVAKARLMPPVRRSLHVQVLVVDLGEEDAAVGCCGEWRTMWGGATRSMG